MSNIVITEQQLKKLKENLKENKDGSYMAKQQIIQQYYKLLVTDRS